MKKMVVSVLLFVAGWLLVQVAHGESQHPRAQKQQVTVQGCVSRSSGHYILMQSGSSHVLEAAGKINIGRYLGQQVKVTGSESRTFGTSASTISGAASPPETIMVDSINTISKHCTH